MYGLGNDHHDYGRGFYLTDSADLAREWAVCRPDQSVGWLHAFRLNDTGLRVLEFQEIGVMAWMAELMKHREARDRMDELIAGPKNLAVKVMSTLV